MQVYPNPNTGHFTVDMTGVNLPAGGKGELRLVDLHGREVWVGAVTNDPQQITVAVPILPAGVYLLSLSGMKKAVITQRVIVR